MEIIEQLRALIRLGFFNSLDVYECTTNFVRDGRS